MLVQTLKVNLKYFDEAVDAWLQALKAVFDAIFRFTHFF
jgi:hypothetical protein